MKRIIIVGSSNMDLTARVKTLPRPGETVGGATLLQSNGGKGANQAVAASRMGADVTLLTCLGKDASGKTLVENLASEGVDTSRVKFSDTPTGTALIFVDDAAENCIAVAPGSNMALMPEDVEALAGELPVYAYMLIQLEIPAATVEKAVTMADAAGVKVILNPAPMVPFSDMLFRHLWLITPNETEAEKLTGVSIKNEADARESARILSERGVDNVIITLGSKGSLVWTPDRVELIPAISVTAVDTTGAGDAYNGALVAALAEGRDLFGAARLASLAASISVTRLGAQTSAPYRSEIDIV